MATRLRYGGPPGKDASKRGRAAERQRFLAGKRGPVGADQLREALRVRRRQQAEEAAPPPTAAAPRGRRGERAAPDLGQPHLWLPIGPSVVLTGQAGGRPRVAGRVRDLQVASDGLRAYAATANGGVWFSDDAGESWRPLGGWTTTGTPPPIDRPSGVLACGCLLVRFGASAATDEVFVGTGELIPSAQGLPFSDNSGIGILHATGPATSDIFAAPWTVEGTQPRQLGRLPPRRGPADADHARRRDLGGPLDAQRRPGGDVDAGRGGAVRRRDRRGADLHRRALGRGERRDARAALGRGARRRRRLVGRVRQRQRRRRPVQPDRAARARHRARPDADEPDQPGAGAFGRVGDVRARRGRPGLALRQPRRGRRRAHPARPARHAVRLRPGDLGPSDAARADRPRRLDGQGRRHLERLALPRQRHRAGGRALAVRLHDARRRRRPDHRRLVHRQRRARRHPCGALRHRRRAHRALDRLRRRRLPLAARQRRQPPGAQQLRRPQQRHGDARVRLRRDPSRRRRPRHRRLPGQRHARTARRDALGPAVRRRRRRRRGVRPGGARPLHRPGDASDVPRLARVVQPAGVPLDAEDRVGEGREQEHPVLHRPRRGARSRRRARRRGDEPDRLGQLARLDVGRLGRELAHAEVARRSAQGRLAGDRQRRVRDDRRRARPLARRRRRLPLGEPDAALRAVRERGAQVRARRRRRRDLGLARDADAARQAGHAQEGGSGGGDRHDVAGAAPARDRLVERHRRARPGARRARLVLRRRHRRSGDAGDGHRLVVRRHRPLARDRPAHERRREQARAGAGLRGRRRQERSQHASTSAPRSASGAASSIPARRAGTGSR